MQNTWRLEVVHDCMSRRLYAARGVCFLPALRARGRVSGVSHPTPPHLQAAAAAASGHLFAEATCCPCIRHHPLRLINAPQSPAYSTEYRQGSFKTKGMFALWNTHSVATSLCSSIDSEDSGSRVNFESLTSEKSRDVISAEF